MNEKAIILFDGVCNLCNSAVQFVIKRDKKNYFSFASLQSEYGQQILHKFNLPATSFNSFVLIEHDKIFTRSSAALMVSKKLDGLCPLIYSFIIVPKFIRDGIYNIVAKNRYKWFGKKDECMLPTPELRARFLS